jgi:hypothetical protein
MKNSKLKLILQKMCFDVKNECIRRKFQECHTKDFFYHTEGIIFLEIFFDVNF